MIEEYQSILKNDVWDVIARPKEISFVSYKWLFKIKHALDGSIEKYKARFITHGFSQKAILYYEEGSLSWLDIPLSEPLLLLQHLKDGRYIK